MAGLGSLRKLDLDHLDLRLARLGGKPFGVEPSFRRAAAEIAAANLPDQIAAMLAVIAADRAFAGVVGEIAELGAFIERANGVGRERTEAHCRNVEHGAGVRLFAVPAADFDAKIKIIDLHRTQ